MGMHISPSSSALATASTPHRVAVAGASGRMGHMLIEAIQSADDCVLAGALDIAGNPFLGTDAAAFLGQPSGVAVTADLAQGLQPAQVLIDFTRPEGTLAHLQVCRQLGVNAVIGTTGFSDAQKAEIAEIAQHIAIMMAPNMSVGVNVTLKLLEMAAKAMSTGYDIEIVEAHHNQKLDAPSGTALMIADALNDTLDHKLDYVYDRHSDMKKRGKKEHGIHSIRGGTIVGEHSVIFAGPEEVITVSHSAESRNVFAQGAVAAARFLNGKPAGLYNMQDLIG